MKQRLLGALAAGSLLVGLVAVPSLAAQGGTERYQEGTTTYTIAVLDTYMHTFVVTGNPCDGSIAITGSTPADSGYYTTETVAGTLADGVITFTSTYDGPYNPGYSWSGSFPVAGGELAGDFTGTVTVDSTSATAYRNHGEYVSSMGGGADAAHSCLGMPLVSGRGMDDSAEAAGAPAPADVEAKMAAIQARLVATLEGVIAKLQANPHAATHAVPAVQKHVDKLTGAAGASQPKPEKQPKPEQSAKPSKPTLPAPAQGHPNKDSHPSRP